MCRTYDLAVTTWSPLAGRFLTGKYSRTGTEQDDARGNRDDYFEDRYLTEENFEIMDTIRSVSEDVGASPAQVSLRWLLEKNEVTAPIIGARTVEQLDENLEATTVSLTPQHLSQLDDTGDWGY
jgi:aryl-alcohol dehydrogenase-like predicted oxidoreductase